MEGVGLEQLEAAWGLGSEEGGAVVVGGREERDTLERRREGREEHRES